MEWIKYRHNSNDTITAGHILSNFLILNLIYIKKKELLRISIKSLTKVIFEFWGYRIFCLFYFHAYLSFLNVLLYTYLMFYCSVQSLVAQMVKCLSTMWETRVQSLGWEDPLEKEMAIHSSTLPGKSHGQRSLEGYSPWGHKESDTTEWLHSTSLQSFSHAQLCNPMNRSMPGLPVHHQLPEFTETHIHKFGDAM